MMQPWHPLLCCVVVLGSVDGQQWSYRPRKSPPQFRRPIQRASISPAIFTVDRKTSPQTMSASDLVEIVVKVSPDAINNERDSWATSTGEETENVEYQGMPNHQEHLNKSKNKPTIRSTRDPQLVEFQDLQRIMNALDFTLIDVRPKREFLETPSIPGAVNLPVQDIEYDLFLPPKTFEEKHNFTMPRRDESWKLIVFGETLGDGTKALDTFTRLGYSYVRLYAGLSDWQGQATERESEHDNQIQSGDIDESRPANLTEQHGTEEQVSDEPETRSQDLPATSTPATSPPAPPNASDMETEEEEDTIGFSITPPLMEMSGVEFLELNMTMIPIQSSMGVEIVLVAKDVPSMTDAVKRLRNAGFENLFVATQYEPPSKRSLPEEVGKSQNLQKTPEEMDSFTAAKNFLKQEGQKRRDVQKDLDLFNSLRERLAKGDIRFFEIRDTTSVRRHGKIPGSVVVSIFDLPKVLQLPDSQFKAQFGFSKPAEDGSNIAVSCDALELGTAAMRRLVQLGYEKATLFPGCFKRWKEYGGPVEFIGPSRITPTELARLMVQKEVVVLDVGDSKLANRSPFPNSINIPMSSLRSAFQMSKTDFALRFGRPKLQPFGPEKIVVTSSSKQMVHDAAEVLMNMGFRDINLAWTVNSTPLLQQRLRYQLRKDPTVYFKKELVRLHLMDCFGVRSPRSQDREEKERRQNNLLRS
ncbi:unnamed protein product [Cyprideis torosa]|uniref:Uncharacterized protein n=1 Tax=Cyprideis torosa TaxID=163714 RepID=A0A7R8WDU0_9CRUS|nr:unnamed protein product [Cyprideis torosa]CAG0889968.1 unnamed protein product [Cyprideis torosa]